MGDGGVNAEWVKKGRYFVKGVLDFQMCQLISYTYRVNHLL